MVKSTRYALASARMLQDEQTGIGQWGGRREASMGPEVTVVTVMLLLPNTR